MSSKRAKSHAKHSYRCPFCGRVVWGNGGRSAHIKTEMLRRMPDIDKHTPFEKVRTYFYSRKLLGKVDYNTPASKQINQTEKGNKR